MFRPLRNAFVFFIGLGTLFFAHAQTPQNLFIYNNYQLQQLTNPVPGTVVMRMGFYSAGDANPLVFTYSATTCVNSDGGVQQSPAQGNGTGCWKASLPQAGQYDYRNWGVAGKNFYVVATGGSDTNNTCLFVATPCNAPAHAVAQALLFGYDGISADIFLADGAYSVGTGGNNGPTISCAGTTSGSASAAGTSNAFIALVGDVGTLDAVSIEGKSGAFVINNNLGCTMFVEGFKVFSDTGNGLFPSTYALLTIGPGMDFGSVPTGFHHVHVENAKAQYTASFTISGGGGCQDRAELQGFISYPETAITVTLSGTPAFTTGYVCPEDLGLVYINSNFVTFSGAATGPRYNSTTNSVIETESGGANYLPGNSAGSVATGGQYN